MTNGHSAEGIAATTDFSEDLRGPDVGLHNPKHPKPNWGSSSPHRQQQDNEERRRQEEEWQKSDQKEVDMEAHKNLVKEKPQVTKKEFLTTLVDTHNLIREEDIWHNKQLGFAIIKLSGIEKIQSNLNIRVTFEHIVMTPTYAVIKAKATGAREGVESYGSCTQGSRSSNPPGDHAGSYIAEMAEKRAKARAVLKLCGAYKWGVKSEDESPDFKKNT